MSHLRLILSICLASVLSGRPLPAKAAELTWQPTQPADQFVDSIGVCTHWNYRNLPYVTRFAEVKKKLGESGIRHVRDFWDPKVVELHRDLGVSLTHMAEPHLKSLEKKKDLIAEQLPLLAMIEGPNEPNNFWPRTNVRYKDQPWPAGTKLWQEDLYQLVRSNPALSQLPVTSPTPIFNGPADIAPLTAFDLLALHPYAGGRMPSASIEWGGRTLRESFAILGKDNDLKPLIATESGYHNSIHANNTLGGSQNGVSEAAAGRYLPRHFAEYFRAGFVRTFAYEFVDRGIDTHEPEDNFGMLRHDLTPKPSFVAVSNMIAILSERKWDVDKQAWLGESDSTTRAVRIAVEGPPNVHHFVLHRADGSLDLVLWNEVPSFDLDKKVDIENAPVAVVVRTPFAVNASLYNPSSGAEAVRQWNDLNSIELMVPDAVVILRLISPRLSKDTSAKVPEQPVGLEVKVTATSATLTWKGADVEKPAAFLVSRNRQWLATVIPSEAGSGTYTDPHLIPGFGFPYTVQSIGSSGLVSSPATITAKTLNQRPNLIITDVHSEPRQPRPSDAVRFVATVKNTGQVPTPAVVHGVAFKINGKLVCWSDTVREPLAPGAEIGVTSNSGPAGVGTWVSVDDTVHLDAIVDDVNRIEESNEHDNTRRVKLSTGVGADLVVLGIRCKEPPVAGKPVVLIGRLRNCGSAPTAVGQKISCTFVALDEAGEKRTALGYGVVDRSLPKGEDVEITIERPWVPAGKGLYRVIAVADDIDRIPETDDSNNTSAAMIITVE